MTDVAVIGIDCRLPGATDPAALWDLLMRGGDGIGAAPAQRWRADDFYDPDGEPGRVNTRFGGFIDDADAFDHEFFGIAAHEAERSDPQQRLLLQTTWRALEDAALDPRGQAGSRTGVYLGVMGTEWTNLHMADYDQVTALFGHGHGYAMIANRLSYELDFTGPSLAVDTACSSSLVAAHMACAALRGGECDQAIVAGVNLLITPVLNVFYTQAGLSAPDGRCKPFSAQADGIGRGEGVAAVVLRRLDDAQAAGLPIYAVIRGGAVNHGGRSTGVTAPNRRSQQAVITEAYENAGVRGEDVAFVEAHGTGTQLGDRIEIRALGNVHGVPRERPCVIGSIKGNIGHAEGAAGIAGLIKAALALHHRVLPPSRYADDPHPRLRLAANGLLLADKAMPLPDGRLVAGVSAFGIGGTNAHLVLASTPEATRREAAAGPGVLTLSAPTRSGLARVVRGLAGELAQLPPARFAQVSWTSNKVKSSASFRFAVVARDRDEALARVRAAVDDESRLDELFGTASSAPVAGWLFAGDGTQFPGMSSALHEQCSAYRSALAEVEEAMGPHLGRSVRELLLSGDEAIHRPELARPALFALGHALGRVLLGVGLRPAWMIGRGVGEYTAATLAGAIDLVDACRLVVARPDQAAFADLAARPVSIPLYSELTTAMKTGPTHLVELGPRPDPAFQVTDGPAIARLPTCAGHTSSGHELLEVVAALYQDGADPVWDELYEDHQRVLHRLRPYEFATSARSWIRVAFDGRHVGRAPLRRFDPATSKSLGGDAS